MLMCIGSFKFFFMCLKQMLTEDGILYHVKSCIKVFYIFFHMLWQQSKISIILSTEISFLSDFSLHVMLLWCRTMSCELHCPDCKVTHVKHVTDQFSLLPLPVHTVSYHITYYHYVDPYRITKSI
jgi:hypothetical protein